MNNKMKLTARVIESLETPQGARAYYYDTEVPGLAVGVGPSGVKTFVLIKRFNGKQDRIKLERYHPKSYNVEHAREAAKAQIHAASSGVNPAEARRASRSGMTLQKAFDDYLETRISRRGGHLGARTKSGYTFDFDNHLKSLATKPLASITQNQLRDIHSTLGKKHKTTANRVLSLASGIFSHADDRKNFSGVNPAKKIPKFREKIGTRYVEEDELPQFFEALAAVPEPWRWAFSLAIFTGVRRTGVLSMQWSRVHLKRGTWDVLLKGGDYATLTLSAEAVGVLEQIPKHLDSDYLFPARKGCKKPYLSEPKKPWAKLMDACKFPQRMTLHDLRRTIGSYQINTGTSAKVVSESLGHKSEKSAKPYTLVSKKTVIDAVAKASDRIVTVAANEGNEANAVALQKILGRAYKRAAT